MYFTKLAPRGILAVHISNRHMDLAPVVANVAQHITMTDPDQTISTISVEKGATGTVTLPNEVRDKDGKKAPEKLLLGLNDRGTLTLGDEKQVTKKYCYITPDDGWYFIESAGPEDVKVNTSRVSIPVRLRAGDLIQIGDVSLRFNEETKEVTLSSLRGHDLDPISHPGGSSSVWVMVCRSNKTLEKLEKLIPPGYEEAVKESYKTRDGRINLDAYNFYKEPYWEFLTFDAEGRLNPYGSTRMKERGPRDLGRPWTDDYSNVLGVLGGTAVFFGILGVPLFGIFLTLVFFYFVRR
jgi:hypothetical protein